MSGISRSLSASSPVAFAITSCSCASVGPELIVASGAPSSSRSAIAAIVLSIISVGVSLSAQPSGVDWLGWGSLPYSSSH